MDSKTKLLFFKTIQLIAAFVGFILYLITYLTPAWIKYLNDTVPTTAGLFHVCMKSSTNECSLHTKKDDILKIAQACGSLGVVVYICFVICASFVFFYNGHWRTMRALKYSAFISAFSAGIFIAAALLLMLQSTIAETSSIGYSGIIGVIAALVALILCPPYVTDAIQTKKPKTRKKRSMALSKLPNISNKISNIAPLSTSLKIPWERSDTWMSNNNEIREKSPLPIDNDTVSLSPIGKYEVTPPLNEEEKMTSPRLLPPKVSPLMPLYEKEYSTLDLDMLSEVDQFSNSDYDDIENDNDNTEEPTTPKLLSFKSNPTLYSNEDDQMDDFDADLNTLGMLDESDNVVLHPVSTRQLSIREYEPTEQISLRKSANSKLTASFEYQTGFAESTKENNSFNSGNKKGTGIINKAVHFEEDQLEF